MSKDYQLGDGPIVEELREKMNFVAGALDKLFNGELRGADRPIGFVLLTFQFGNEDGRCNFISNGAAREDIVVLFKELITRFEGQPEVSGNA